MRAGNGSVDVLVLGASLAGLAAAAAAAGTGARVLLLDRDPLPAAGPRPGVPQGAQPHLLLHRGLRAAEQLLPGLREELLAAGAVRVDSGLLPWLGEHGWLPDQPSYEIVSLTRPLLEHAVRERVLALPGVELRDGARVTGLEPAGSGWRARVADGGDAAAPLVVDATGRGSRLRRWLAGLGMATPGPATVDAQLGYATRLVAGGPDPRVVPGVVVQATPATLRGGIALPVEGGRWILSVVGMGELRPPRDPAGFAAFAAELPDPALHAFLTSGEPVGDVAVHRQTGNRRQRYARVRHWPEGLLAVGDALCCFNPVYGQGMTVAACQALLLREALGGAAGGGGTRRLLAAIDRVVDFPWAVATGQDVRMPTSSGRQTRAQAATSAWASALARRAVQGDRRAYDVLMRTYHLEGSPAALLHPALVASVVTGRLRRPAPSPPRPAVLDALRG